MTNTSDWTGITGNDARVFLFSSIKLDGLNLLSLGNVDGIINFVMKREGGIDDYRESIDRLDGFVVPVFRSLGTKGGYYPF